MMGGHKISFTLTSARLLTLSHNIPVNWDITAMRSGQTDKYKKYAA